MNFRRWITALAVLTLFVGIAAAQTSGGGGTAMTCNTVAQVVPTIRSEGITELVGDIVITCQGGTYVPLGTAIPQGNIVISLTQNVTSRLASSTPAGAAGTPSEAILMVDEPNSGLAGPVVGFGPSAPLNVCSTPGTGCVEYATQATGIDGLPYVVATDTVGGTVPGRNVFQGNVSVNTITFQGIPILPPVTAGVVRVYRITNIRVNATGAGSSVISGVTPVYAFISTNGSATLPISNNGITVAFASPSLTTSVTAASTKFQQCNTVDVTRALDIPGVALLNYSELFPSAFKTRVAPNASYSSYLATSSAGFYNQKTPGQLYTSESGFILPVNGLNAGLADFGTRFKAVFNNLPAGATIYVSQNNVTSLGGPATAPAVPGGYNVPQIAYASLVSANAATTAVEAGAFPTSGFTTVSAYSAVPAVAVTRASDGSAVVVWEVINTNTSSDEKFTFGVYIAYAPNTTLNQPTLTPATNGPTVTLSYAPTTSTSAIPRFLSAGTGQSIINIVPCQTILLFPYVTTKGGFDTGIAISNTSSDPLGGTPTSEGTCQLTFYGENKPTGTVPPLGPIATGTPDHLKAAFQASTLAPDFQGYMFAVCNFQYAHGFAFVSDIGARNLAMGYLALIINDGATGPMYLGRPGAVNGEALTR